MRRVALRAVPPVDRSAEPGYREWHAPIRGHCAVCEMPGPLERHHVVAEQHVRQLDETRAWDLRNALELGRHCRCHSMHTNAAERLPASAIPADAIEFAIELLGAGPADLYIDRYYRLD